jgi:hypothetical protein
MFSVKSVCCKEENLSKIHVKNTRKADRSRNLRKLLHLASEVRGLRSRESV